MPFPPEIQALVDRDKEESRKRVEKMTEAEREELRKTANRFARKHRSCYYDVEPEHPKN